MFDQVVIMLGEVRCLSLLGLKGLTLLWQGREIAWLNPHQVNCLQTMNIVKLLLIVWIRMKLGRKICETVFVSFMAFLLQ